jgi:Protein of unknown function (DUF1634)
MTTPTDSLLGLEHRLGRLFVIGLTTSASALATGLIAYLLVPDARAPLLLLNGGLAILMATPLLRVIVSIAEYVRMRDWFFVLTTIAVLVELTVTMLYALTRG